MAESAPLKKSSIIKEWMVQADPKKEANGPKMDNWSLLLSPNIAILYFKYGREQVVLWKKNMLSLQKFEAPSRPS